MGTMTTEAWVLYAGEEHGAPEPGRLVLETFTFPSITESEVLAEPLFGSWEGNMAHALERRPVDICRQRREPKVVLGNSGIVRVVKTGANVTTVREGDLAILFCNGVWDEYGYPKKILGYDAPGTMGVLARQMKLHERQLIPIPARTRHSVLQWAAFSLRYITAWSNWKMAYGTWRLQMTEEDCPTPTVWAWGGGSSLAELELAKLHGCRVAMLSSCDRRLAHLEKMGIQPIDRLRFPDLVFDDQRYSSDPAYREAYQASERAFLETVSRHTNGEGVSIFIDYVGSPVYRATLRALARQGVITTAGWKEGMKLTAMRAIECIQRHTHVHTHYARYAQGVAAVNFAEECGWLPEVEGRQPYAWNDVPELGRDYASGRISDYFPLFTVNGTDSLTAAR